MASMPPMTRTSRRKSPKPLKMLLSLIPLLAVMETAAAQETGNLVLVAGRTCKQVSSCEEAVELWCGGYRRADADSDGIPCENVCRSVDQVNEIRQSIGC